MVLVFCWGSRFKAKRIAQWAFFISKWAMKNLILFFTLGSLVACSSAPTESEHATHSNGVHFSSDEEELPKARSPKPGTSLKTISETIETPDKSSIEEATASHKSCNTPLGDIPHGGQLTGYVKPTVGADEICISDTVRCNNGVWKGEGIYPKCVKEKAPTTK